MKTITSHCWYVTIALLSVSAFTTRTAIAQGQTPVVLSVERFMLGGVHNTKGIDSVSTAQKLPSPGKALTWSLAWTLVPIAAGAAIWSTQESEHVTEYYNGYESNDYYKDPNRTLPLVIIAMGVIIGPSAGYFYGDCDGRGGTGIAIRGLVAAATVVTAAVVANSVQTDGWLDYSGLEAGLTIGSVGGGIMVIDALYDLARVQHNVEAQNNRKLATRVGLAPGISVDGGTPMLNLCVTF